MFDNTYLNIYRKVKLFLVILIEHLIDYFIHHLLSLDSFFSVSALQKKKSNNSYQILSEFQSNVQFLL